MRVDVTIDELQKEGKLLRGKWRKCQWIGTNMMEKMERA
jgi:hypothetical protein